MADCRLVPSYAKSSAGPMMTNVAFRIFQELALELLTTMGGSAQYRVHAHNSDVIMIAMASQITSLTVVYSTVYSGADQRKHQSSASLALNSQNKMPVTRKMFPFDDVIMYGNAA